MDRCHFIFLLTLIFFLGCNSSKQIYYRNNIKHNYREAWSIGNNCFYRVQTVIQYKREAAINENGQFIRDYPKIESVVFAKYTDTLISNPIFDDVLYWNQVKKNIPRNTKNDSVFFSSGITYFSTGCYLKYCGDTLVGIGKEILKCFKYRLYLPRSESVPQASGYITDSIVSYLLMDADTFFPLSYVRGNEVVYSTDSIARVNRVNFKSIFKDKVLNPSDTLSYYLKPKRF